MTGPSGNSEFCFPSNLNVPLGFASGNIECLMIACVGNANVDIKTKGNDQFFFSDVVMFKLLCCYYLTMCACSHNKHNIAMLVV